MAQSTVTITNVFEYRTPEYKYIIGKYSPCNGIYIDIEWWEKDRDGPYLEPVNEGRNGGDLLGRLLKRNKNMVLQSALANLKKGDDPENDELFKSEVVKYFKRIVNESRTNKYKDIYRNCETENTLENILSPLVNHYIENNDGSFSDTDNDSDEDNNSAGGSPPISEEAVAHL